MNENSEQPKSGIKIVDRRRFDSEGQEKPEETTQTKEAVSPVKSQATEQPQTSKNQETISENTSDEHSPEEEGDISFSSFVISMATQALMLMGQIKAPEGMPLDPGAAKQTIDILTMLESKTKGNLKPQEKQLLNDALHNLKVAYLKFS